MVRIATLFEKEAGRKPWAARSIEGGVCGSYRRMNRQKILDRLRENEGALRARGVMHAALFGSRARGDDRPGSDTDIMIDVDAAADLSVYDYVGLKRYIASLFDGPVDVVDREGLKPHIRPVAESDSLYAF
jgi:predicted nucleotidyltransferase